MEVIKKQIKSGAVDSCYLFYGSEEYIKNQYVNRIKEAIIDPAYEVMNCGKFNGKDVSADQIIDFAETVPFMSNKRMMILQDSGLFKTGRKDDSKKILDYLDNIPSSTCIVFLETEIDKRSSLYKKANKMHTVVEFVTPTDREIFMWIRKELKKNEIEMENSLIEYFIHIVPSGMESIINELKKLIDYKQQGVITKEEITRICTHSLDVRIFELVKMLGNKDTKGALKVYANLLEIKESPIGILAMMARQFRIILKVKYMRREGNDSKVIATRAGIHTFLVNECVKQAQNFTFAQLESAIRECLETDEGIKTGKINPELGVELILVKYSNASFSSLSAI